MNEGSVPYDAWVTFCDDFSRAYGARRANLSLREEYGSVVPIAEGLTFSGIGADLKDSENAVTIILSDDAGEHMTHTLIRGSRYVVNGCQRVMAKIAIVTSPLGDSTDLSR